MKESDRISSIFTILFHSSPPQPILPVLKQAFPSSNHWTIRDYSVHQRIFSVTADCARIALVKHHPGDNNVNGVTYQTADVNANFLSCFYECYGVDGCGYIYGFAESNGNYVQNQTINSLRATVTLACSYNAAVCNNRLLFAEAFWYLLGIEFLEERLYSERVNFYTSIKREEAKELISLYNVRYDEALKNALGVKV